MDVQQNKIAYVTGSSKGIGKAISELLLSNDYHVYGVSRTNTINHHHFFPIHLDLSDLKAVEAFYFDSLGKEVLLINNAGAIGEIAPVGSIPNHTISNVMQINSIAPQILMNKFINTYREYPQIKGHILNISSGAGKYPIDAWATYCASKAALDLFSETVKLEFQLHDLKHLFIHSVAPGVVDTEMQQQIRNAKPEAFKSLEKFIQLKAQNELNEPEIVAEKLFEIIQNPSRFDKTILSLRDL